MRLLSLLSVCLLSICVLAQGATAAAPAPLAPGQLLDRLQKKYDSLQSFRANFTQTYQSKRFSEKIVEKGVVYFQKGGKMRWDYQLPEKKLFVSDGSNYFYYMPQDRQVIKAPMQVATDQHSPTLFFAGRGNFSRDFRAEWSSPDPQAHLLKLTPVEQQPDFKYLIADVDPVTGLILRLVIVDEYDNRTEFTFNSIQENPPIPNGYFAFQAPPGTDVIYQRDEKE